MELALSFGICRMQGNHMNKVMSLLLLPKSISMKMLGGKILHLGMTLSPAGEIVEHGHLYKNRKTSITVGAIDFYRNYQFFIPGFPGDS